MHVSILASTSAWGGAELHGVALSQRLIARGHRVSIVEMNCDIYSKFLDRYIQGVDLIKLSFSKPIESIGFIEAYTKLRSLPPDVAVFSKGDLDTGNWRLDLAARRWFRRLVSIEHLRPPDLPVRSSRNHLGGIVPGLGLWRHRVLAQRWARSLGPHLIVTVSEDIRNRLIRHYRFSSAKMVAVHGGIDVSLFRPNADYRGAARKKWGIANEAFVFGAVGRLAAVKGFSVAIGLFGKLLQQCPDRAIYLVLVGNGPEENELKAKAKAMGLENRIIFKDFTQEPWQAYPGFDAFIMPSVTEGLGLALLESMACGCPGIAMNVGGVGEIITDPSLGWLLPEGDQESFFLAMRNAVQCPSENLLEMGRLARERVISHFDAEVLFNRLADLLEAGAGARRHFANCEPEKPVGADP